MKNYLNSFKSIYLSNFHFIIILSLIISNYIFIVNLFFIYENGITEYQEKILFISGWITITTFGILQNIVRRKMMVFKNMHVIEHRLHK